MNFHIGARYHRHARHPEQRAEETNVTQPIAVFAAVILVTGGASVAAQAGSDAEVARSLAATCANCHGTGGVSQGTTGSLSGMSRDELVRAMQDFKTGRRAATIMPQLAKGYTDAQIEQIADWYAAQGASK